MSIVGNCKKCSLPIDTAVHEFTVCEGRCSMSFHMECACLTVEVLRVLSTNVLWMCSECVTDFCRYRERQSAENATQTCPNRSIEKEVKELKIAVADITRTLARTHLSTGPIIPHHSTPLSSKKLPDGTLPQETDESSDYSNENERNLAPSPSCRIEECDSLSLYLTNIDRCCSESNVSQMVSRCLCAPISRCKQVLKLVPKWMDCRTLGYISFKIELDKSLKRLALTPSTWPKGVKFREFVERLGETWKPN